MAKEKTPEMHLTVTITTKISVLAKMMEFLDVRIPELEIPDIMYRQASRSVFYVQKTFSPEEQKNWLHELLSRPDSSKGVVLVKGSGDKFRKLLDIHGYMEVLRNFNTCPLIIGKEIAAPVILGASIPLEKIAGCDDKLTGMRQLLQIDNRWYGYGDRQRQQTITENAEIVDVISRNVEKYKDATDEDLKEAIDRDALGLVQRAKDKVVLLEAHT